MVMPYDYYNFYGGRYYSRFLEKNPEFDTREFHDYVVQHNRGDRDSGEVSDIAKHEVLRLAADFEEMRWRFPNGYGKHKE